MANYSASIKINATTNLDTVAKKFSKSFEKMNASAKSFSSSLGEARKQTAIIGKGFAVVSGVAIAAGAAMFGLAKSVANVGDDLFKTAQKTGISVKELQRLRYAADLGNVSSASFTTSLKVFSRMIDEAAGGTQEQAEAFQRLGISLTDSNGVMKTTDALMMEVADRFSVIKDGAGKASIAQQLFGRSGLDMIPMLNEGGAAIRGLGDELERNGRLISDEEAMGMQNFNDSLTRLKTSLSNVAIPIAVKLIPAIEKLVLKLTDFFANIETHMPKIILFGKIIAGVATVLGTFFGPVLLKLALGPFVKLAFALKGIIASTWAFNAALLANPITWIIVGIIALIAAIVLLVKNWDTVSDAVVRFSGVVWDKMKIVGKAIFDYMIFPLRSALKLISKIPKVGDFAKNALEGLDDIEAKIFGGDAPEPATSGMSLDVNMNIDQSGRANVIGAQADGPLNFNATSSLMVPQWSY